MEQLKVVKAYPGIKVATVIGKPVYDMICELAVLNDYSVACLLLLSFLLPLASILVF